MAADRRPWWRRLTTVRARATIAATLIVGVAIAAASVSLVVLMERSLIDSVDEIAELRAEDVAALASQGDLPERLAVVDDDSAIVQVVDDGGAVVSATTSLEATAPIADFRPSGSDAEARTVDELPGVEDGPFRVAALATDTPDGPVTIYVASSLEPVDETLAFVRGALAVGAPLLLLFVAFTTWVLVGRALRPVEAIRAEVGDISERSLDRRVPVPATDDEVSRLAETMNVMLDRLEAASARQRRFVGDASHELQTPLASARTDLEVALAHPDRSDWRQTATDLLAGNRRMERLVRDLLFLARTDDAAPRAPAVPVDLDDTVLAEVARLQHDGRARVDTSRVSAAAVRGRRDDLGRAVRNLLDNADRYASSTIIVELRSDDSNVTLVVADDGPGIPAEHRQAVFERFARLDDARARETGGTGLGLAIAKEIVTAHGGSITLEDSAVGARFVVRLPIA
jgi:signal transduction histidine kinase